MSLFAELEAVLKKALLNRDLPTVEVLKLLKSEILLQAKAQQTEVSDEISRRCLDKKIKNYQEAAQLYKEQNQIDRARQKEDEIGILKQLLPPQLEPAALEEAIDRILGQTELVLERSNFKSLLELIESQLGHQTSRAQIAGVLQQRINN